jgi:hypothetical protein
MQHRKQLPKVLQQHCKQPCTQPSPPRMWMGCFGFASGGFYAVLAPDVSIKPGLSVETYLVCIALSLRSLILILLGLAYRRRPGWLEPLKIEMKHYYASFVWTVSTAFGKKLWKSTTCLSLDFEAWEVCSTTWDLDGGMRRLTEVKERAFLI